MDLGQRDAEHFAFIFVKATEDLLPNEKIFIKGTDAYVDKICAGNSFKAYLPPKAVISMTHVWKTNCLDIDIAKGILKNIVNKSDNLYVVSDACKLYLDSG